ncbi:IS200/IS605 family transposase [Flammeovirgaceae bacterium SG7u.111]|nr:IS200/IS605 family transposase [Flammeovirgaceae bacterium SG7u.132]WPO33847.1 IS200/IS605 family transposase [Flammeovirgaceae bacterium SG7u.111]
MSFIKVYVHFVWSTKNRMPLLTNNIRQDVFKHIKENAQTKNIFIDFINGFTDHVHCLVSLNDDISIRKTATLIKGESSHWINKQKLTKTKFQWQDEYLAIGVDDEKLPIVRKYIANQEEHHKNVTFAQEYDQFIRRYGFDVLKK